MRDGIATARPVPVYSAAERAEAARKAFGLTAVPTLGASTSLTPNSPYGRDGAHLSIWKPSFVLGTAGDGEAGFNFWGIYNEGHVNVGFTSGTAAGYLLDCRLLSAGEITWKIYDGAQEGLREQGRAALIDNHLLLRVAASKPGDLISVELWPTPLTEPMGLLGCDLSAAAGLK